MTGHMDVLSRLWQAVKELVATERIAVVLAPPSSGKSFLGSAAVPDSFDIDEYPPMRSLYSYLRERWGLNWKSDARALSYYKRRRTSLVQAALHSYKGAVLLVGDSAAVAELIHRGVVTPNEVALVMPSLATLVASTRARELLYPHKVRRSEDYIARLRDNCFARLLPLAGVYLVAEAGGTVVVTQNV